MTAANLTGSQEDPKPYFVTGDVLLYHADCREILPYYADHAFDVVITDPPYSPHTHAKHRVGHSSPHAGQSPLDQVSRPKDHGFAPLDPELRRFCAAQFGRLTNRWCLVFSDMESTHHWQRELALHGLEHVRTGIWHKPGATPQFTADRPANVCEAISIAHSPMRKRWNGGGSQGYWSVPPVRSGGPEPRVHTAQKPLGLIHALVADFTDPGERILDAFAGAGTMLVAAKLLGRKAVGIEQSESDCEKAAQRLLALDRNPDPFIYASRIGVP
jgi:hypothetical protein